MGLRDMMRDTSYYDDEFEDRVSDLKEAAFEDLEETWSDAARAAAIAARKTKGQGGNWRKAGRQAFLSRSSPTAAKSVKRGAPAAAFASSTPSGHGFGTGRAGKVAAKKTGEKPGPQWRPSGSKYPGEFNKAMTAGYKRRAARFKEFEGGELEETWSDAARAAAVMARRAKGKVGGMVRKAVKTAKAAFGGSQRAGKQPGGVLGIGGNQTLVTGMRGKKAAAARRSLARAQASGRATTVSMATTKRASSARSSKAANASLRKGSTGSTLGLSRRPARVYPTRNGERPRSMADGTDRFTPKGKIYNTKPSRAKRKRTPRFYSQLRTTA